MPGKHKLPIRQGNAARFRGKKNMAKSHERTDRTYGVIQVADAGDVTYRQQGSGMVTVARFKCTWQPPKDLLGQLPRGFELAMQCSKDEAGDRQFFPWNSFDYFLALASAGGLAILAKTQNHTSNERHSYRAMRLLFLRVHHLGARIFVIAFIRVEI